MIVVGKGYRIAPAYRFCVVYGLIPRTTNSQTTLIPKGGSDAYANTVYTRPSTH